jgi:hypothetical protein
MTIQVLVLTLPEADRLPSRYEAALPPTLAARPSLASHLICSTESNPFHLENPNGSIREKITRIQTSVLKWPTAVNRLKAQSKNHSLKSLTTTGISLAESLQCP